MFMFDFLCYSPHFLLSSVGTEGFGISGLRRRDWCGDRRVMKDVKVRGGTVDGGPAARG
jgi:hypothetical protein